MSSLYNIDFGLLGERISPPSKRKSTLLAWIKVFLSPIQWLSELIRNSYLNGIDAYSYNNATVYKFGDIVKFNGKIFQYINSNSVSGINPSNAIYWDLILPSNLGIRGRINFNSQTIVLQYILNERFNYPENSPIWIDNADNDLDYTIIYKSEERYPPVYLNVSEENLPLHIYRKSEYIPEYDFKVKVPSNLLPSASFPEELLKEQEKITQLINSEIFKYKIAGVNHVVIFY
jgi:hypothetical protein